MAKASNLVGQRFGFLTALMPSEKRSENGSVLWDCVCDCGNHTLVATSRLVGGSVKSCGCMKGNITSQRNTKDISGERFGKLTAIKPVKKSGRVYWECVCDCGNITTVFGTSLRTGHTTSCGCYFRNANNESKSHLYMHYGLMKSRCSPKYHYHKSYYDKGVKVCDEWSGKDGYLKFKAWALDNGYKGGLSLDRIDNDGNYEPSNCRWATNKEQANNRSTNSVYEYNGMRKNLTQWSEYLGISYSTLCNRRKRGINPPELFEYPKRKMGCEYG